MSTGQILTVVGYAVGSYFGYPQLGAIVGGLVGSAIDASNVQFDVPKVNDLKAPQIQYGAKLVRLYGSNRTSGALAWYSAKRVIPGDSGGKGAPSAPTADTAEIDVLYILAVDSSVIAVTRVWKNGELVWSQRADSDSASLAASTATEVWADIRFLDGNAAQLPDPTIEASEGVGNAPAYRHRQCVLIESLQLGQSGQMPLIEFECITAGTLADPKTRLESYFDGDSSADISAFVLGSGTLTGATIAGGALAVNHSASGDQSLTYESTHIASDGVSPITIELFSTWISTPNVAYMRLLNYLPNAADTSNRYSLGYYGDAGRIVYDDSGFDEQYLSPGPLSGRVHMAIVFSLTGLRVYFNGTKVYDSGVNALVTAAASGRLTLGDPFGYASAIATHYEIDEFAIRFEEQYTGASFTVPDHIKPPDGFTYAPAAEDLADIVSTEWARVDDAALIDVSELAGIPVRGFQTSGSVRGAFEALSPVFHFGAVASDKLYFRLQGAASAATLAFTELAAGEDKPADEPFAPERANDEEIPERTALTYPNISDDYANGTETGNRGIGDSTIVNAVTSNVVMTPAEAKAVAETYAAQAGIAATTGQVALTDYYAALEPTDCITVPDEDGTLYRMRITRETYGGGVKQLDLVRDDVTALIAPGITSGTYTQSLTIAQTSSNTHLSLVVLDIRLLREEDNSPGLYVGAYSSAPRFLGGVLYETTDGILTMKTAMNVRCTFGIQLHSDLLDPFHGGNTVDEGSTVTVELEYGELSSITRSQLLNKGNVCIIGNEIFCFQRAELIATRTYVLTGLLRGLMGTELHIQNHADNDVGESVEFNGVERSGQRFVLLDAASIYRVIERSPQFNILGHKLVPFGKSIASTPVVETGFSSQSQITLSVSHLGAFAIGGGLCQAQWKRRGRLYGLWRDFVDVPIGEESESYTVQVLDGATHSSLLSETIVSSPEATVTASIGDYVLVWQNSAIVGSNLGPTFVSETVVI